MSNESVRWTVSVSPETDASLRSFLSEHGQDSADFSQFVEDAVKWRMFDLNLTDARRGFDDLTPEEAEALIDEAVRETRREHAAKAA